MFAYLCCIVAVFAGQDKYAKPEALRKLEASRSVLERADIEWSRLNFAGKEPGERFYFRSMIAPDGTAAIFHRGTADGFTHYKDGERAYSEPICFLRTKDNDVVNYTQGEVIASEYDGAIKFEDIREIGLTTVASFKEGISTASRTAIPFEYQTEENEDGTQTVTRIAGEVKTVWSIDPQQGWNATKIEVFKNDNLVSSCEIECKQYGETWFPTEALYFDSGNKLILAINVDKLTNDQSLPNTLGYENIGMGNGVNLSGKKGTWLIANNKKLTAAEYLELWKEGKIEACQAIKDYEKRAQNNSAEAAEADNNTPPKAKVIKLEPLPESDDDPWDKYVASFIVKYDLDKTQTEKAQSWLNVCKSQREKILQIISLKQQEKTPNIDKINKLELQIEKIFNSKLCPGLDKLLTRKQIKGKEEQK